MGQPAAMIGQGAAMCFLFCAMQSQSCDGVQIEMAQYGVVWLAGMLLFIGPKWFRFPR